MLTVAFVLRRQCILARRCCHRSCLLDWSFIVAMAISAKIVHRVLSELAVGEVKREQGAVAGGARSIA